VKYALFILPRAQREIASLSKPVRDRIKQTILALADDPRPALAARN
jgi:mRNA-degrading endonuclease RelE of RelBE toxin-antitoxin system